jgi:hypothetical protein
MFQPRQYFRDIRSSILSEPGDILTRIKKQLLEPILPGIYGAEPGTIYYNEAMDENIDFIYWPLQNPDLFPESGYGNRNGRKDIEFDLIVYNKLHYPVFRHRNQNHFLIPSVRFIASAETNFSRGAIDRFMHTIAPLRRYNYSYLFTSTSAKMGGLFGTEDEDEDHWSAELSATPSIRSAVFFEKSEEEFTLESLDVTSIILRHFEWPDIILLLNEGKVLIKEYVKIILDGKLTGLRCNLRIHNAREDIIFLFADLFFNYVLIESGSVDFSADTGFLHEYPEESASSELPI